MSSPTSSGAPQERPSGNPEAQQKHIPPYSIEFSKDEGPWRTVETFMTFGRAYMRYTQFATTEGYRKRLVNGEGRVITSEVG